VSLRYSRVDPWVISPDTDAEIAFLTEVFDATETPGSRMLDAEGPAVTKPTQLAFGERVARVRDPQGHLWWIHEDVEDVDPGDLGLRFPGPGALESMTYVQQTLAEEPSRASD
jgi:uncharacterized glyoxalase superfamily protein PhnB